MILDKAKYIEETVRTLVKKTGGRNPVEICREKGCFIHYMDLKRKLKAYYFYQSRIHNIVIDTNVKEEFHPILIAHELGHMMLHKEQIVMMRCLPEAGMLCQDADPLEYEANLFAAELLLSDEEVIEVMEGHTFFQMAKILSVPAALLDFKYIMLKKKGYEVPEMQYGQADFLKKEEEMYE